MARAGRFDINGDQDGEYINNVARDQYFTQVLRERESFLRDIAATRSKARHLVTLGFLMVVGGATAFMVPILMAMNDFRNIDPSDVGFGGPEIGGVSVGLIGFGVGFVGQFILLLGIVLHVVVAARRRRLPDLPPPPRWEAPYTRRMPSA
jgi:hypothetical protein